MNILFYGVLDTISLAMFEDLAEELRKKHMVRFEFGNVIGKQREAEEIVKDKGYDIGLSDPDIMFISDFRSYPRDRNCIVINLEHGLGSKESYYFPDTPYDSDYLFCSSKWIQKKFKEKQTKFIATGWPKLDRVKRKWRGKKTVLIAPTWNDEYNCMNIIEGQVEELANKYRVIIKPHQYDKTDWKRYGVESSTEYNVARLFSVCDVVVSDVSSVYLEFIALNRPVVICETDFMKKRKLEKPDAHEYYFQGGASKIINTGDQLLEAVDYAMKDIFNFKRFLYSRKLLSFKGRATKKVIRELNKIEIKFYGPQYRDKTLPLRDDPSI